MTLRGFDPAFSDDLRRELVSRAATAPAPARSVLRRPQVWVTVVTAIVLLAATLEVLHAVHPAASPARSAHPSSSARSGTGVVDPLTEITQPGNDLFLSRSPRVLLHEAGGGEHRFAFAVPEDVTDVQVLAACGDGGTFTWSMPRFRATGRCSPDVVDPPDVRVQPGTAVAIEFDVVGSRDAWLVIAAIPAPELDPRGVIDPVHALVARGATVAPLLRRAGTGALAETRIANGASSRLRVYFACRPASRTATVTVAGHRLTGCSNSIGSVFDVSASAAARIAVDAPDDLPWELLVVPAA